MLHIYEHFEDPPVLDKGFTQKKTKLKSLKERAAGVCQLCNKPAPFYSKNGEPYLECHHVIWIKKNGLDEVNNAVALCPNCHKKMHILDEKADVEYLKKLLKKNECC